MAETKQRAELILDKQHKRMKPRNEKGLTLLGADLQDQREEAFARMVADGLPLGAAFTRAGFKSASKVAASNLFSVQRMQERIAAILKARQTQGVVTLPEVTEMLQRVFTGAFHKEEYSAAHNAAFSLARLYGHVTDRATLEVIRRPSRDPDAPSEQALGDWVAGLPAINAPAPQGPGPGLAGPAAQGPGPGPEGELSAPRGPRAALLDHDTTPNLDLSNNINWLDPFGPSGPQGPGLELSNEIKGLGDTGGRPENGAPVVAVTGTPSSGAHTELLDLRPIGVEPSPPPGGHEKGAPRQSGQVPVPPGGYPPAEELF